MAEAARQRESGYARHPGYDVHFEPSPKRVRVVFNNETIADTLRAQLMFETKHIPVYYFPRDDVRMDLLTRTDHATFCPFKGEASYWTLDVGDRREENVVWSYEAPFPQAAEIRDYVAFYWHRMDHWFEEDEEVFVHARDPYKRIDTVVSHRPVQVILGGEAVAETGNAVFLFETGLPTRYYIPPADVRTELLTASDKVSACPYKGEAGYWSATVNGQTFEDIAWGYADPIPEAIRIRDLICFFNEQVDAIIVDGAEQPRPQTKWSRS